MVPPASESLKTVGFSYFSKGDGGRKVLTHLPRIIKNRWIVLVFEGGGGGVLPPPPRIINSFRIYSFSKGRWVRASVLPPFRIITNTCMDFHISRGVRASAPPPPS